jgi:hypothetical protein
LNNNYGVNVLTGRNIACGMAQEIFIRVMHDVVKAMAHGVDQNTEGNRKSFQSRSWSSANC